MIVLRSRREWLDTYTRSAPTWRQGYQVRVTMCRDHVIYDHMICMTQGYVTFEPGEPTGGMA